MIKREASLQENLYKKVDELRSEQTIFIDNDGSFSKTSQDFKSKY